MDSRNTQEGAFSPEVPGSLIDDGIHGPQLAGSRCEQCGETYFPSRRNCPQCMSSRSVRRVALSSSGILDGFVVAAVAPPGFGVPHAQGYIRLNDDGPRIFSLLTGHEDGRRLHPGCEMSLEWVPAGTDSDGRGVLGYRFRPLR